MSGGAAERGFPVCGYSGISDGVDMKRLAMRLILFPAVLLIFLPIVFGEPAWNAKAAAAYLDGRAGWWTTWPKAMRDHDTFCISCHTALPYVLARPALSTTLAEAGPTDIERRMFDDVAWRVSHATVRQETPCLRAFDYRSRPFRHHFRGAVLDSDLPLCRGRGGPGLGPNECKAPGDVSYSQPAPRWVARQSPPAEPPAGQRGRRSYSRTF